MTVSGVPNTGSVSPDLPLSGLPSKASANAGKAESFIGSLRVAAVDKASEMSTALRNMIDNVKQADQTIARALFAVGCAYNLWANPLAFIPGLGIGALSSAASFPFKSETLQKGYLLDNAPEKGYPASGVMLGLAALKFLLSGSVLDAMSISIFAGLLAGNSLYHRFKGSTLGQGIHVVSSKLAEITDLALGKLSNYTQP